MAKTNLRKLLDDLTDDLCSAGDLLGLNIIDGRQSYQALRDSFPSIPSLRHRDGDYVSSLAVHHSGGSAESRAADIAVGHLRDLGWSTVGYAIFVYPDGDVEVVQSLSVRTPHGPDGGAIGMCVVGTFMPGDPPPQEQYDAAAKVAAYLALRLSSSSPGFAARDFVRGHCEYGYGVIKAGCPGFAMDIFRSAVSAIIGGLVDKVVSEPEDPRDPTAADGVLVDDDRERWRAMGRLLGRLMEINGANGPDEQACVDILLR